jgi:microcystin-dependent protein
MEVFVGYIMLVPYGRIPDGWFPCMGGTYSISQYNTLFVLLGTRFGGNGQTTFAVPDLQEYCPTGMMYIIAHSGIFPSRA